MHCSILPKISSENPSRKRQRTKTVYWRNSKIGLGEGGSWGNDCSPEENYWMSFWDKKRMVQGGWAFPIDMPHHRCFSQQICEKTHWFNGSFSWSWFVSSIINRGFSKLLNSALLASEALPYGKKLQ